MNKPPTSLARSTMRGSAYSIAASAVTISLGALRTYLMVDALLEVDFGLTTLALFFVSLIGQILGFGLYSAFLHLKDPTEEMKGVYFALSLVFNVIGALMILVLSPVIGAFYPEYEGLVPVLWAFAGIKILKSYNVVQLGFLSKDLAFGRLAAADVISSITSTIIGPWMAYQGYGPWAIVGENFSAMAARFLVFFVLFKGGIPRIYWNREHVLWFLNYGKSVWMNTNLVFLLDRFDDFWIGTSLGQGLLGLYSRAYEFASYARKVVAAPLLSVFTPTFASLQNDRHRLSRAFFQSSSVMVRGGALFSLLFILLAPEVFSLILPERWHPMIFTFQLMIVYTLFDPLSMVGQSVLLVTGHPDIVARTRWVQALVFLPSVILGAWLWGINGVALAADLMVATGTVILFRKARLVVDYSAWRLWGWPMTALVLTILSTAALTYWGNISSLWLILGLKLSLVILLYGGTLILAERDQLIIGIKMVRGLLKTKS